MRLFIVDDSAPVREALRLVMGDEPDIDVVGEADNGVTATQAVAKLRPDVVLMDIEMPGGDGLQATQSIKHQAQPPIVIVMSVYRDETMRALARAAGADHFLDKSAGPEAMLLAVRGVNGRQGAG